MHYPVAGILLVAGMALLSATGAALVLAKSGFPLPDERKRLGTVDGLRGYLALSVMLHHFIIWFQIVYLGGSWAAPTVHLFNSLGSGGVGLFFMATGFVFYPRILQGFAAVDWRALYIGRVFRIVPAMVASMAIIAPIVLMRVRFQVSGHWYQQIPHFGLWLTGWSEPPLFGYADTGRLNAYVFWSLWYEWVFYILLLPALALLADLIRGRAPSWLLPLALAAASAGAELLPFRLLISQFMPSFAAGMLAFELRSRPAVAAVLQSRRMTPWVFAALIVAAVVTAVPYRMPQLLVYGVFFACVACGNRLGGVLSSKAALVLGECSFSIYILHGIVLDVLFMHIIPRLGPASSTAALATLPIVAPCVVLFAALISLAIEKPFIRYGKMLARRLPARIGRQAVAGGNFYGT
ncbi:MAG TPA: acyltransferase [Rhodopila sp.]|nr:acyltransferase [Rhodopila sp.]